MHLTLQKNQNELMYNLNFDVYMNINNNLQLYKAYKGLQLHVICVLFTFHYVCSSKGQLVT